jgi:hypothetical protein
LKLAQLNGFSATMTMLLGGPGHSRRVGLATARPPVLETGVVVVSSLAGENWCNLIQTVGIMGSLWMAAAAAHREAKAREIENILTSPIIIGIFGIGLPKGMN